MAGSILSQAHFHDEEAAYAFVEARIWPKGAVCPHCGGTERNGKMGGKSTRIGAYKCYDCRKPFTVKIGTIFEASHIAMHLWLQAITLIAASKKGISSNQLHRTLGITLKSAWFMSHRIREAMRATGGDFFGGNGGFVEVDETFIGQDATKQTRASKTRGFGNKQKVLSIVDRTSGQARSQVVMDTKAATLLPLLQEKIAGQATLMTDEALQYYPIGKKFRKHERVNHSVGEYVSRLDAMIHTNTLKAFSPCSSAA